MLHLNLFGGLTACVKNDPPFEFRGNLTGTLLAYLALYPDRAHPREHLADLLWPDDGDVETARQKLRQTLRQLRRKLDEIQPGMADRVLVCTNATVRLASEQVRTDVSDFLRLRAEAELAAEPGERAVLLSRAADLYHGELLAGFYQEAFDQERERFAAEYRALLLQLIGVLEETGQFERAVEFGRKLVATDMYSEDAYLTLMRLYARLGQPGEVSRVYMSLGRALREELGVAPDEVVERHYAALMEEARGRAVELSKVNEHAPPPVEEVGGTAPDMVDDKAAPEIDRGRFLDRERTEKPTRGRRGRMIGIAGVAAETRTTGTAAARRV